MFAKLLKQSLSVIFIASLLLKPVLSQPGDPCYNTCLPYNNVLDSCLHDDTSNSAYNYCVCNADGFAASNAACVACTGVGSAPYQFQQACKSVVKDCTVACVCRDFIICS